MARRRDANWQVNLRRGPKKRTPRLLFHRHVLSSFRWMSGSPAVFDGRQYLRDDVETVTPLVRFDHPVATGAFLSSRGPTISIGFFQ
jgi:hypothetical protein